jgi:hypothetical protein
MRLLGAKLTEQKPGKGKTRMTSNDSASPPVEGQTGSLLEWIFAILGAIDCIAVSILFSLSQLSSPAAGIRDILPLPGIYFLEISALGVLLVVKLYRSEPEGGFWKTLPWVGTGLLLAFVILGALSIGFFLIPAMLSYLGMGILSYRHDGGSLGRGFGISILAALIQASIIYLFLLISL